MHTSLGHRVIRTHLLAIFLPMNTRMITGDYQIASMLLVHHTTARQQRHIIYLIGNYAGG